MGPGHFGVGLAAKAVAPGVPLWALLVSSEALDLLCFGFITAGIERFGISNSSLSQGISIVTPGNIPWSHGLLMALAWSALSVGLAYLFLHDRRSSLLMGLVVFSHWILDFITHLPDLPLAFGGSPLLGLGLWGSGTGLVISGVFEVLLIAGGLAIYFFDRLKRTKQAMENRNT